MMQDKSILDQRMLQAISEEEALERIPSQTYTQVDLPVYFHVNVERTKSGLLYLTSNDFPGLNLALHSPKQIQPELQAIIKLCLQSTAKEYVSPIIKDEENKKYPEHAKQRPNLKTAQLIGEFIDWARWAKIDLKFGDINAMLAEYYDIDAKKLEQEKQLMLDEIRQKNRTEADGKEEASSKPTD